jgi:hypothetical protein
MIAAIPVGRSQSPSPEPRFSFRAIAWNRELPEVFFEAGEKRQVVPLYRGSISQEQTYDGSSTLTMFIEVKGEDGKVGKVPLVTCTLKPAPSKNLVVVWMEKNGAYSSMVLPDETETLAPGNARFINITGRRLAINCGGTTYTTDPGGQQVVAAVKGGVGVKIAVQMETKGGGWKLATMNSVRVRPNARVTVFIADPSRLAVAPEDMDKEIIPEPLSLFVITDRVDTSSR